MSESKNAAKNTMIFSFALVIQKAISFVYFTLIARIVGVDNLGEYLAAISFAMLFSLFMDIGISQVLIRETARAKEKTKSFLSNTLGLKALLSAASYICMIGALYILIFFELGHPPLELVLLAGLVMILDTMTLTLYSVLRGYTHLGYEAIGTVVHKIVVTIFGLLFLELGGSILSLMFALVLGGIFNVSYLFYVYFSRIKMPIRLSFETSVWKPLLVMAWPFALAGLFATVFANIDSVLLRALVSEQEVGIYGVPIKIVGALQFIPLAFVAGIYPSMSRCFPNEMHKVRQIFEQSIKYLLVIALPIVAGTFVIGDELITRVYTIQYVDSVFPLYILISSLVFIFLNFPVGYLFNSCNKQLRNTIHLGIAVGINLVLNLIFIPLYGAVGASFAVLGAYIVYFALGMYVAKSLIQYRVSFFLKVFLQAGIASLIMYGLLTYVFSGLHLLLMIVLGAIIYAIAIYLLGGVNKNDIYTLKSFIKRTP